MMLKSDVKRIYEMGHRKFVGGDGQLWDEIAALQFDFMKSEGLRPENILLDVACGCLRAGRLFINYLNSEHYLGIDKEVNLIIHGVADELGMKAFTSKKPYFVVSSDFEFERFPVIPEFAIAQSLFTHLTPEDIFRCLKKLRNYVRVDCKLYATFFEVSFQKDNPKRSDALDCFFYTREQMELLADICGWRAEYIGDWKHPRDQKMLRLIAR